MAANPQEQLLANALFQQPHLMADGRLAETELDRRLAETAEPGGGLEALQELQRRYVAMSARMNGVPQREESNSFDRDRRCLSILAPEADI